MTILDIFTNFAYATKADLASMPHALEEPRRGRAAQTIGFLETL